MPRATKATATATKRAPRKVREPREVVHIDPDSRQTRPIVFNDTMATSARVEALIDPAARRKKSDVLRLIMAAGLPIVEEQLAPQPPAKLVPQPAAKRAARKVAAR